MHMQLELPIMGLGFHLKSPSGLLRQQGAVVNVPKNLNLFPLDFQETQTNKTMYAQSSLGIRQRLLETNSSTTAAVEKHPTKQ